MSDDPAPRASEPTATDPTNLFRAFGRALLHAEERARMLPHYGERALERESALVSELNGVIPSRFRAARGFVLFASDLDRSQVDCLVYDAHTYGVRSSQGCNVVALAKSVAAIMFETSNLTPEKLREDLERIERLKRRIEQDTSFDPLPVTPIRTPLAFVVAVDATRNGEPWDVLGEYQAAFRRLFEDAARYRHLADGVLILRQGQFLSPVVHYEATDRFVRTTLTTLNHEALPVGTVLGFGNGPGNDADAGDHLLETLRSHLMQFKNPTIPDNSSCQIQINPGQMTVFARHFRRSLRQPSQSTSVDGPST